MIVELEAWQAWSVVVDGAGVEVALIAGQVWLTRERDGDDHVLAAPQIFRSTWPGRLAVQALGPARLEVRPLRRAEAHLPDHRSLHAAQE